MLIDKAPIPSPEFIKTNLPKYEKLIAKSHLVIGHTRKWTQGKPADNNNNHPVISDNWAMVHNGICSSMNRIEGYKYRGEVDSEILLSYIETYGISEGLSYLNGYAAIAVINTTQLDKLYLWSHREDIYLGYDKTKSTIFFCSSEKIAEEGLANELVLFSTYQIREVPDNTLYELSYAPLNLRDLGEIEIKKPVYRPIRSSDNNTYKSYYGHTTNSRNATESYPKLVWSSDLQCLVTAPPTIEADIIEDRYYFPKQSSDFINWIRSTKCFISPDGLLLKVWDKDKATHFIISTDAAIKGKVIAEEAIKNILEVNQCSYLGIDNQCVKSYTTPCPKEIKDCDYFIQGGK